MAQGMFESCLRHYVDNTILTTLFCAVKVTRLKLRRRVCNLPFWDKAIIAATTSCATATNNIVVEQQFRQSPPLPQQHRRLII